MALESKHGRDQFWDWWEHKMKPVVKNLTGDRGFVGSYLASVYVDTETEAEAIAMMFRTQIIGVLDWDEIKWILLPPPTVNPDLD